MAKKKTCGRRPAALAARPPVSLVNGLNEADDLLRRSKPIEARAKLDALDRRYPNNPDVLAMLVNVNYDIKDIVSYQRAIERLSRLTPDDPDVALGLAGSYLLNTRPVLALQTFRRFLERFPDHPRAGEARKTVAQLEAAVADLLDQVDLSGAEGLELAELHEQLQSALGQGDYAQVRRLAEHILQRKPDFAPALNNLSQASMIEGKLDQAIATAERVLAFDPGNIHALANLAVYHCRLGHLDEARAWAERLQQSDQPAADKSVKIAEALSYLGDDQGVLAAFHAVERSSVSAESTDALLYHLAAVAELRLGREAEAKRHWKRALKLNPGMTLARDNLDDLARPIGERHAPWPFDFGNWMARQPIEELSRQIGANQREAALPNLVGRFLQKHPDVAALVPILLDRGDPQARQFALLAARTARTPELLAALRDFALSQRGPDQLRHQAAQVAEEAGLFPERTVRMWTRGEWHDVMLMGFEISNEPDHSFSAHVEALMTKATLALHEGQGPRAERLLHQALELAPDSPALLNNLAMAKLQQGHTAEAEAIVRDIHARHPDYLFARVAVARMHIRDKDFAAAQELLTPLLARRKLHHSEATALFSAQVNLYEAQGNHEAARTWVDMWANIDPDNPEVKRRQLFREAGGPLGRLLSRRRG